LRRPKHSIIEVVEPEEEEEEDLRVGQKTCFPGESLTVPELASHCVILDTLKIGVDKESELLTPLTS
jgi:hypothetical protein